MSELYDELISSGTVPNRPMRPPTAHPHGWEPGLTWDGDSGVLNTGPLDAPPDKWDHLLEIWNLDPAECEVLEPVQFRAWDANVGDGVIKRMFYYRASVISRRKASADVEEIIDQIRFYKPRFPDERGGEKAFVWCIGDLQIGKGDGDGTPGTVNRFIDRIAAVKERATQLRSLGRDIGTLYIAGLGDCVENVSGHYAAQTWTADLSMTQQVRVIRRLLVRATLELAPLFDNVVMAAVPGNHGEAVRKKGKAITEAADNWDVECFTAAYEVISAHRDYDHVKLFVPKGNDLALTLDMAGTITTLAHGHQFNGGSAKRCAAMNWWMQQAHGMQTHGDSTLLLAGHLHHFRVEQTGLKTFIQVPALDGGSEWWTNSTGQECPPGMVTLVVGDGKWQDLEIL